MNATIKKLIPKPLLRLGARIVVFHRNKIAFLYDCRRYVQYSGQKMQTQEAMLAYLMLKCHSVEKGLTMPDFRYGFGENVLKELLPGCSEYLRKFDSRDPQFIKIIHTLAEYRFIHRNHPDDIPDSIATQLNELLSLFPDVNAEKIQLSFTREEFFANCNGAFDRFARSRHSIRDFSGESIPISEIEAAVTLALSSPSACNRQPVRVIAIQNRDLITEVFKLQGGNRGFGHTVDKLLIVTGLLSGYWGAKERNCVFVDGGIFTMNLAYALHFHHIGNCILNWSVEPEKDLQLHKLLNLRDDCVICSMLACGLTKDKFSVCASPRKTVDKILQIM